MSEPFIIDRIRNDDRISLGVLIGSRAFGGASPFRADSHSDWDLQLLTRRRGDSIDITWLDSIVGRNRIASVLRKGRLGSVLKLTAIYTDFAVDITLLPHIRFRLLRLCVATGLDRRIDLAGQVLRDLARVIYFGYAIFKGERRWGRFFNEIASRLELLPLSDSEILTLSLGFVCDYRSTIAKIKRGEHLAGQRWLHIHLLETLYILHHELRRRQGLVSFPDARRLELLSPLHTGIDLRVESVLEEESLLSAVQRCADIYAFVTRALLHERAPSLLGFAETSASSLGAGARFSDLNAYS